MGELIQAGAIPSDHGKGATDGPREPSIPECPHFFVRHKPNV
jgi:hypothetical protein